MSFGSSVRRATVLVCCLPAISIGQEARRTETRSSDLPKSWIDSATSHRVLRLTSEPGSASLYFHQNAVTGDHRQMIYTTPRGISVLDLTTLATRPLVEGGRAIVAGRHSQNVYYTKEGSVFSTDVDSGATRLIAKLPPRGSVATVNADESLLAGTYLEGGGRDYGGDRSQQTHSLDQPANKGRMMEERLAARLPMALFVIDVKSGARRTVLESTDWLNHLQFSPTDPTLLLFCHEGPWHTVERIWTIRTDGGEPVRIHVRTMAMEIFGHEFWSADGKTIWYDLQTPRGEDFWLAGYELASGVRTWYHLQRNEWSIHFNASPDGTLFAGDGGDESQVAQAPHGRWIYLFRPELLENRGVQDPALIRPGVLRAERLVDMSRHQYRLEPNVIFTPDQKWIVFRSNMFGPSCVFAVEVAKSSGPVPDRR